MIRSRIFCFLAAVLLMLAVPVWAWAAEVDCNDVYCFSETDFSEETLAGICITAIPDSRAGVLLLGSRILRPGDILTAGQLAQMTFSPALTQEDAAVQVSYLPMFSDHVAPADTMTLSIRGKEDKAPAASDSAGETYKNLPLEGNLTVKDPEGQALTYTLIRSPRRGDVILHEDGSFTYTPRKNKVGVDSFVFTATDPAGNVSREATVTITILKPADAAQYTDTLGKDCRFAAEWMKNTGIFVGETVDGNPCFNPEKEVTRGQFTAMLVNALQIPVDEEATFTGYTDEIPQWLKPYLAAAVRAGITAGLPDPETFRPEQAITGAEAAMMLQNALDLAVVEQPVMAEQEDPQETAALQILAGHGISLPTEVLTRGETANALYQASKLAQDAPGALAMKAAN